MILCLFEWSREKCGSIEAGHMVQHTYAFLKKQLKEWRPNNPEPTKEDAGLARKETRLLYMNVSHLANRFSGTCTNILTDH